MLLLIKKGFALLLALVFALCAALSAGASELAPAETEPPAQTEDVSRRRLWLILGGTVAGVTGMWAGLYRRGKGSGRGGSSENNTKH